MHQRDSNATLCIVELLLRSSSTIGLSVKTDDAMPLQSSVLLPSDEFL